MRHQNSFPSAPARPPLKTPAQIVAALKSPPLIIAALILAAGVMHLGYQIEKHWDLVTLDFRFFWLAGDFWTSGRNPYEAAYAAEAFDRFGIDKGAIWYYPPNWLPIAALMSWPEPLAASRAFLFINAALLLASACLNVLAFERLSSASRIFTDSAPLARWLKSMPRSALFLGFAGLVALAQASGNTMHLGQSSIIIYAGASLLLFAATRKRLFLAALGLAILLLKPQLGVLVAAALAFTPFGRRAIVLAGALTALAAAPAFLIAPPVETLAMLAAGVSQYKDQFYNMPAAVTGLRHVAWLSGAADMGSLFYLLLSLALVAGAGVAGALLGLQLKEADFIALAIAIAAAASPLHVYDFAILAAIALYAAGLPRRAAIAAIIAYALCWRAGNLAFPAGLAPDHAIYYPGSFYASAAAAIIAGAILTSAFGNARRARPAAGALARAA